MPAHDQLALGRCAYARPRRCSEAPEGRFTTIDMPRANNRIHMGRPAHWAD